MRCLLVVLSFVFALVAPAVAAGSDPATKDDLKQALQAIDRRFEQIDRRFEQIEKRFEQIDKRLEFHQNLILAILGVVLLSPFAVEYMARRRTEAERKELEELRKTVIVLRELSRTDKKVAAAMRVAGLQ
ncbi:MAG: hypothetical protein OHK0011_18520 [Turneriella sp.]